MSIHPSVRPSVRISVRTVQLCSNRIDTRKLLLGASRKFFDEFKSLLKSHKYNRRFNQITKLYRVLSKYRVIQNDFRGTIVQRQFRTNFGKHPPSDSSIRRWYAEFQKIGCLCIPELKVRIRTAIETITANMLQTVWNELNYRVDVCRITKGAHIEHL